MYGGIQNGWTTLADVVNRTEVVARPPTTIASTAAITTESGVASTTSQAQHTLPLQRGQFAKAVHRDCLAGTLKRAAQVASSIRTAQAAEGSILRDAVTTASHHSELWMPLFDERLRSIKEYHARHSTDSEMFSNKRQRLGNPASDGYDLATTVRQSLAPLLEEETGEEVFGKYLDLKELFEYVAHHLKPIFPVSTYSDFLQILLRGLSSLSEQSKLSDRKKYLRFLSLAEHYLKTFIGRTSPLLRIDEVVEPAINAFEEEWGQTGGVAGWVRKPVEAGLVKEAAVEAIDLSGISSADELAAAVDGDRLKTELSRLGLKCGGTVQDRAKRLFLTKDTPLDKLPPKLFAKKDGNGTLSTGAGNERRMDIARRETLVTALLGQLRPILEATYRRIERRQTQTIEEQEKELEEALYSSEVVKEDTKKDESDDEDEAPVYNPKNVPLDWDGKPIPYWLFKLHGLNHYFPCEICGGETYRGRRNFELHFAEQKHSLGMKSLGIPNTKHFHGVTKIEDAQDLWKSLQEKLKQDQFDNSREEEYEDSHGNVLSRTTYEDLARQGLL